MRRLNLSLLCAAWGMMMLALSGEVFAQNLDSSHGAVDASRNQVASVELPDSPGAVEAQTQNPGTATGSNPPPQPSPDASPSAPAPQAQDSKPERPVGTAAAEAPPVSGITAAQPAGVAVAPAKQHRVRTIVLKVGAILGAGAAIGAVVALSEGTSSKPPGAH
jgi:hypothetical protein